MPKRTCLGCSATISSGSRCTRCNAKAQAHRDATRSTQRKAAYGGSWRRQSERIRKAWVEANGWVCPGWATPPHPSTDLVVDHDVGVLCRSCNSRKAATYDRGR